MQHDTAGSLKLHRLFEVRRALKVTEPCPHPPPSSRRPGSRSRTCAPRSTADAIPSRRPTAIASTSRRRSSRTATTSFAPSSATGAAGSRKWLESPLEPLGNDRWAGSFQPTGLGRWQFTIEAWVDRYATLLDELDRKLAAGQTELAGELSEAEALFGPGEPDAWRAVAAKLGAKDRHGKTSLRQAARGRRRARPRPVRRLVRALPPQLGRLQGRPEGAARNWPSSASTSSTCRRSIRSGRRTARAGTTR